MTDISDASTINKTEIENVPGIINNKVEIILPNDYITEMCCMENRNHSENNFHNDNSDVENSVEVFYNQNKEGAENSSDQINYDSPNERTESTARRIKEGQYFGYKKTSDKEITHNQIKY